MTSTDPAVRRRIVRRVASVLAGLIAIAYLLVASGLIDVLPQITHANLRQLAFGLPAAVAYMLGSGLLAAFDSRTTAGIGAVLQLVIVWIHTDLVLQGIQPVGILGMAVAAAQIGLLGLLSWLAMTPHPPHLASTAPAQRPTADAGDAMHAGQRPVHGERLAPSEATLPPVVDASGNLVRVLVVYGSDRGGTEHIASLLGEAFRRQGLHAEVVAAQQVTSVAPFHAAVIGGAVYRRRWHRETRRFIRRHYPALVRIPVWLFSSGPLAPTKLDDPPVRDAAKALRDVGGFGHASFGGRLVANPKGWVARRIARQRHGDWLEPASVDLFARRIAHRLTKLTGAPPRVRSSDS